MPTWLIEPRDPLIVRDGRPFGPQPGARATTLTFPFPSTTTGGVRTRAGQNADGVFTAAPADVKRIAVRGPLLVELDHTGEVDQWLAPAPADALLLAGQAGKDVAARRRLVPLQPFEGTATSLPAGLGLVGMPRPDPAKPLTAAPRFWYWRVFEHWLTDPPPDDDQTLPDLGHGGPTLERRVHVSIAPDTGTNVEGALFQTSGLEFTRVPSDNLGTARRLALAVESETDKGGTDLSPLGGERRLVVWRRSHTELPPCPSEVRRLVAEQGHCRLVLLTPAYFEAGSRPAWLQTPLAGVTPELKAAAILRAQVVSGWDFEKARPKPTRKLMPAGSVLFLRLNGAQEAINTWIDAVWMRPISDDEQDRRDGFGLAALGTWDGRYTPMEDAL